MHFLKRNMSLSRFKIIGEFQFNQEEFDKLLYQNSFRDLSERPEQEESFGWVSPENCLEPPKVDVMLVEPYLKLVMRLDRRKISRALLSAHIAIEERAALEASGKAKLSINERREIRNSVKQFLMEKTMPTSSLYQALWNFKNGTFLVFSTSKGIKQRFSKLFTETFQLELEPQGPWPLAYQWADNHNLLPQLDQAEPAPFISSNQPTTTE